MFKINAILTIISFTASGALFMSGSTTAQAADMISDSYYREQAAPAPKAPRPHRIAYRVVSQPLTECDLLKVSYRPPYVPATEIVEVCYKPLDLRPGRS